MSSDKSRPAPSFLRIAGVGCGAVVLLIVIVMVAIVTMTYQHYGRDIAIQSEVERRHGTREAYRIPPDGSVAGDRVTRFLAVRRSLMPRCEDITEITSSFRSVDAAGGEKAAAGSLFGRVADAARHMPSMGLVFGEYVTRRNQGLLDQEMGFGEYSWIYVAAYFAYLRQPPTRVLEGEDRLNLYDSRVFREGEGVIARHVAATGLKTGPWVEELARLERDRSRVPFRDGLPPELAASFEPFREELARVACPAAAELDLTVTVRRALWGYDHR